MSEGVRDAQKKSVPKTTPINEGDAHRPRVCVTERLFKS